MIKHKLHNLSIIFLYIFILTIIPLSNSAKPSPKCQPNQYYRILPLVPNENAILNLDNIFDGYNLNFTLERETEWAKYITLSQKMRQQKKQVPDTPLIGLKTYHLDKVGNSWGTSFVAMLQRGERTYLSYGFLSANTSAPVINNQIRVQNFTNTTCFDAVIFPKQDVLIVDCAVKLEQPDQYGYNYINIFYYFRISDHSFIKTIKNQMFIPFESITDRRLQLYTEKVSGNTYMLRAYIFDGVDQNNQNNTYIDVFMITKPLDPWVVSVIDRSFLSMSTLRVSDIRVYLSQIYVLDYTKGLHRVRINTQQDLVYNGFYQAKGFNKFSVYSNNLDDRFQLALANNHQVIQIDWSHIDDPILLNKYSLLPNSNIKQLFINQRFVIVLSSTQYTSKQQQTPIIYNYTWILNRGDRTYTKAFRVLKHDTLNTLIDLNTDQSYLMIIDQQKIVNIAIDQAILVMSLKHDQDFLDRIMNFTIVAKSIQPTSQAVMSCSFIFNFTLVEENNRTMWAVGDAPAPYYNANFPGKVVIPIHQYALGPNITYRITQVKKGQIKKYKIFQQDQLKIHWQKQLPLDNLIFLRTQTITRQSNDFLVIYTQNKQNITYVSLCTPNHKQMDVLCNQSAQLPVDGQINNWATTIFVSRYTLRAHHIVGYTTKKHYNKVIVDDVTDHDNVIQLQQGKGFAGNVTNVQTYGRYLFVIKRYYKIIHVYDLQLLVQGIDQPICSIDHKLMYNLGVKYFSPQSIQTTQFYPNILFIKTSDTIIVLDMNRQCVPKLLSVLHPVQSTLIQFSFAITRSHLIVTAIPNLIIQYDLSRIYIKDIKLTKKYPMYGYKLPKNYDTDVSQYGSCVYITTVSQGGDYQVFIYRAGYPAVAVLYDVIDLYTYQNILVDASGGFIDYVTVYSGTQLRIFRQYQTPIAQIDNPQRSYSFYIEYYNIATSINLQLINVSILNLPTKITVNPYLNDIMNTKDLLYSDINKISQINDTDWYDGNVLTIKSDCRDCQDLVIVKNHIHYQNYYTLMPKLIDYGWNYRGGAFLAYDAIVAVGHDGNVRDFIHLPQASNSICLSTTAPYHSNYQVSACIQGQGVNLYLTSMISHKGFTFAPYSSKAQQLYKIEAVHQLLIVVDSSANPFFKTRPGGVILYALNFDMDQDQAFQEIQYIDYTDFTNSDKPSYVVNADLSYHPQTDTYRLYITQIKKGIYCIIFKYTNQIKGINILQINYINIPQYLSKLGLNPPYDATYQAIKVTQSYYDNSLLQSKDIFILTTGVYHTMMFQIIFTGNYQVLRCTLNKVFLRYAYYVVQNQIKYVNGLIVLRQVLPQQYQQPGKLKSRQIISVYDIRAMPINLPDNKIPQLGLIGAYMIMDRQQRTYDLNLTYNTSDPHDQPRVNMVIVHQFSNKIDQLSLHRNLSVFTKEKVDTQIIYLDLINDFDIKKIRILLNGWSPYPQWKLITIILFSIIGFFILLGVAFIAFKKIKAYRAMHHNSQQAQQRTSLLTQQKTQRNSLSYGNTQKKQRTPSNSSNQKKKQNKYGQQKEYDNYNKKDSDNSNNKSQSRFSFFDRGQKKQNSNEKNQSKGSIFDRFSKKQNTYDQNQNRGSIFDRGEKRQSTYDRNQNRGSIFDRGVQRDSTTYDNRGSIFDRGVQRDSTYERDYERDYNRTDNRATQKNDKYDRYDGTFYS